MDRNHQTPLQHKSVYSGECQRERSRLQPHGMKAFASKMPEGTPLELQVTDITPEGAGALLVGESANVPAGTRLNLQISYKDVNIRMLSAVIVHRKRLGPITHLGITFYPDEGQDRKLRALQSSLILEQPLRVRRTFVNGNRMLLRHL